MLWPQPPRIQVLNPIMAEPTYSPLGKRYGDGYASYGGVGSGHTRVSPEEGRDKTCLEMDVWARSEIYLWCSLD